MAIFNSFLLGQVSKSVGNVTMCQLRGESVARGKIKFRRDNPTPEVLDMRAKIRELGGLGKRLVPVIRKGFVGVGGSTTSNAFVKMNLGAVDVTAEHVATVDFDRLKLASGVLIPPSMTVTNPDRVNVPAAMLPPPASMTRATPTLEPELIPRMDESAKGLLNTVCSISPEADRAAPQSRAVMACGKRDSRTIKVQLAFSTSLPHRMSHTASAGICTEPMSRLAAARPTISRIRMISYVNPRCFTAQFFFSRLS